jgi:hypothetical protein
MSDLDNASLEIAYILRAVAARPISSTDSSCAFCQAYGDESHGQMEFDESHECIVLTAQRLLEGFEVDIGEQIKFDSVEAAIAFQNGEHVYQHPDGTYSLLPNPRPQERSLVSTVTAIDHKGKIVTLEG